MAVTVIEQSPIAGDSPQPVGQDFMFVVSNSSAVANQTRVKFIAQIHVSDTTPPNPNTTNHLEGTFKTTPNSAGVGMFNVRNVIENYVKADNMAANDSTYKAVSTNDETPHPLHIIDRYSVSTNISRWLAIRFSVEYLDTDPNSATYNKVVEDITTREDSELYFYLNGYLKYTDILYRQGVNFSYDMSPFFLFNSTKKFLTNAPNEQFANIDDYGTFAFIPDMLPLGKLENSTIIATNNAGVDVHNFGAAFTAAFGGYDNKGSYIGHAICYLGCFPGNLQNQGVAAFQNSIAAGDMYGGKITITLKDDTGAAIAQDYIIHINCPDRLGYEPIRLCWLNQWGAWDYYTFTKKSVKTISTKGSTYTQLEGTWNESLYKVDSFKGGKKSFRVNATEKIKMNTDFVRDIDNVMFEELTNSPEIYLLEGFQTDPTNSLLNNYITPVRLSSSSFTKKTLGNDQLIQYTFEIEKTKTLRTQAI